MRPPLPHSCAVLDRAAQAAAPAHCCCRADRNGARGVPVLKKSLAERTCRGRGEARGAEGEQRQWGSVCVGL